MMLNKKYVWVLGVTLLLCSQALMAGGSSRSRRHHPYGLGRIADMAAALEGFRRVGYDRWGRPSASDDDRATTRASDPATIPMDVHEDNESDEGASTSSSSSTSPLDVDSDEYPSTCTSSEDSDDMCVSETSDTDTMPENEEAHGDFFWLEGLSDDLLFYVLHFVEGADYLNVLQTSTYYRDLLQNRLDKSARGRIFRPAASENPEDRIAAIHEIIRWLTDNKIPLSRRIQTHIMSFLIGEAFFVNDTAAAVRAEIPYLLECLWLHARTTDQERGFFIDALAQLSNREVNREFLEALPVVITHIWTEGSPNRGERGRLLNLISNLVQAEWTSHEGTRLKEALVSAIRTIAIEGRVSEEEHRMIIEIIFMNLTDHGVRHTIDQTHPQLFRDISDHRLAETRAARPPVRRRLFED